MNVKIENNRTISAISHHKEQDEALAYLKKISYFLGLPLPKEPYIDLTAIDPQQPPTIVPKDLILDNETFLLAHMTDKIRIREDQKGVIACLVRNDPRRCGKFLYDTVVITHKQNYDEFAPKINSLKEFMTKKKKVLRY